MDFYREPTYGGFPRAAPAAPPSPAPGTIKTMIERFRHGEPMSRAERERLREEGGQSQEFWWRSSDPGSAALGQRADGYPEHHRRGSVDRFGGAAPLRAFSSHGDARAGDFSLSGGGVRGTRDRDALLVGGWPPRASAPASVGGGGYPYPFGGGGGGDLQPFSPPLQQQQQQPRHLPSSALVVAADLDVAMAGFRRRFGVGEAGLPLPAKKAADGAAAPAPAPSATTAAAASKPFAVPAAGGAVPVPVGGGGARPATAAAPVPVGGQAAARPGGPTPVPIGGATAVGTGNARASPVPVGAAASGPQPVLPGGAVPVLVGASGSAAAAAAARPVAVSVGAGGARPVAVPVVAGGARPVAVPAAAGGARAVAVPVGAGGARPFGVPAAVGGARPAAVPFGAVGANPVPASAAAANAAALAAARAAGSVGGDIPFRDALAQIGDKLEHDMGYFRLRLSAVTSKAKEAAAAVAAKKAPIPIPLARLWREHQRQQRSHSAGPHVGGRHPAVSPSPFGSGTRPPQPVTALGNHTLHRRPGTLAPQHAVAAASAAQAHARFSAGASPVASRGGPGYSSQLPPPAYAASSLAASADTMGSMVAELKALTALDRSAAVRAYADGPLASAPQRAHTSTPVGATRASPQWHEAQLALLSRMLERARAGDVAGTGLSRGRSPTRQTQRLPAHRWSLGLGTPASHAQQRQLMHSDSWDVPPANGDPRGIYDAAESGLPQQQQQHWVKAVAAALSGDVNATVAALAGLDPSSQVPPPSAEPTAAWRYRSRSPPRGDRFLQQQQQQQQLQEQLLQQQLSQQQQYSQQQFEQQQQQQLQQQQMQQQQLLQQRPYSEGRAPRLDLALPPDPRSVTPSRARDLEAYRNASYVAAQSRIPSAAPAWPSSYAYDGNDRPRTSDSGYAMDNATAISSDSLMGGQQHQYDHPASGLQQLRQQQQQQQSSSFIPLSSISAQTPAPTEQQLLDLQRQQQLLEGAAAAAGALLPPQQQALLQHELLESAATGGRPPPHMGPSRLRGYGAAPLPPPPRWDGNALGLPPPVPMRELSPGWAAPVLSVSQQQNLLTPQQRFPIAPYPGGPMQLPPQLPRYDSPDASAAFAHQQQLQNYGSWPAPQYGDYSAALAEDQRRALDAQHIAALEKQLTQSSSMPAVSPPFLPQAGIYSTPLQRRGVDAIQKSALRGHVPIPSSSASSGALPPWPPAIRGRRQSLRPADGINDIAQAASADSYSQPRGLNDRGRSSSGGRRQHDALEAHARAPSPSLAQSSVHRAHAALDRARAISRGHRSSTPLQPRQRDRSISDAEPEPDDASLWQQEVDFSYGAGR